MNRLWFLATLAALAAVANGYEIGAPKDSCDDMKPQHGAEPQLTPFPYSIKLSDYKIRPGGKVSVTLTGRDTFRGFFVQARVGNRAIGHFDEAPGAKFVPCHGSAQSGITHTNKNQKKTVTVTWNAPKGLSEKVVFWVTIVKEGREFWVAKKSDVLTVG